MEEQEKINIRQPGCHQSAWFCHHLSSKLVCKCHLTLYALSRLKAVILRALGAWRKLRKSRQTSWGRGKESFHSVHSQSVGLDSHQLKDLFRTWWKENIKADGYSSWWGKTCVGTQLLISEALVISGIIWPQLLVWRWYRLLNLWAGPSLPNIYYRTGVHSWHYEKHDHCG